MNMYENQLKLNRISIDDYDAFFHCFEIPQSGHIVDDKFPIVFDFFGFLICQSGSVELEIDNEPNKINAGDLMTMLPNTMITKVQVSKDFNGFGLAVKKKYLDELSTLRSQSMLLDLLHIKENPIVSVDDVQQQTLIEMLDLIRAKYARQSHPFRNEITGILIVSFIFEIYAIYTQNKALIKESKQNRRYDEIFKKFLVLLSQHSQQERSVSFYAQQLCICPKYLTTIVKNVSGRGVHSWIEQSVTSSAKTLLRNTSLTIQEIANKLNFSTATFFGQYFKRVVGVTPKVYRRNR